MPLALELRVTHEDVRRNVGGGKLSPDTLVSPRSPVLCLAPSRRSPSYIVCNTTSADGVLDMKVTVQVDRAKIRQDLVFQYVEDPTIVRIEPEWSIVR